MKKKYDIVKISVFKDCVVIDGQEYPPTHHNLKVWNEYKATKDEKVLQGLSKVSLDI